MIEKNKFVNRNFWDEISINCLSSFKTRKQTFFLVNYEMKNKSRYPSFSFKQNKIYKTYRDINWSLQGLKHYVPSITQDRPIIEFPDKYKINWLMSEAATRGVLCKKAFLEISQNSQENTCTRASFSATLLKKRLRHMCFPVNFAKVLRTHFLKKHLWWLLLSC